LIPSRRVERWSVGPCLVVTRFGLALSRAVDLIGRCSDSFQVVCLVVLILDI
jgi:hypothetical protein